MSDKKIHERVKALRKESRITQEPLAQYLDVDQTMITKLENGTRNLNTTMIDKLCSLFGCTEEYLNGESDEYIPLHFSFKASGIDVGDLESIAAVNKIALNIRCMQKLSQEN